MSKFIFVLLSISLIKCMDKDIINDAEINENENNFYIPEVQASGISKSSTFGNFTMCGEKYDKKINLLHHLKKIRLWNSYMRLNSIFYEKQLRDLKIDIKYRLTEFNIPTINKENGRRLISIVKTLTKILVLNKSKWLVDTDLENLENWLINDYNEVSSSQLKNTNRYLEQYRAIVYELDYVCKMCYEGNESNYPSWEYFIFRGFLKPLTDFCLLVQPKKELLLDIEKCIDLYEEIYDLNSDSCSIKCM